MQASSYCFCQESEILKMLRWYGLSGKIAAHYEFLDRYKQGISNRGTVRILLREAACICRPR
jgi:hypothetical protein